MADGKTLIVPTNDPPTFWNKEAAIGTLMFPVVGTIIGGFIGKARMEREKEYGKPIDPPSFWNKTTVIGALAGILTGAAAMLAVAVGTGIIGAASSITPSVGGVVAALGGSLVAGAATWMGTTVIGGFMGKNRIAKEYAEAEKLVEARNALNIANGKAPGHAPSKELADKLASGINGGIVLGYAAGMAAGAAAFPITGPSAIPIGEIGGAIIGGLMGKSGQKERYAMGDVVTREEAMAVDIAKTRSGLGQGRGIEISKAEALLLEERLSKGSGRSAQDRLDIGAEPALAR